MLNLSCSTNKTLVMSEKLHKCPLWSQTPHSTLRHFTDFFVFLLLRVLRNASFFFRECSVLSFPLEIIWSQEQNIKTSIKHGQSNWISIITLSWFIEAQFKLRVQWNAASFGADVGNSFVSSFQLEFQPVFLLLSGVFSLFFLVFFWGIVGSKGPPKRLLLGVKHDTLKKWSWCWCVDQLNRTYVNTSTLKSLHPTTGGTV